ncbi:acetyl/propionyl/methylcrotonyl-CoA carboxylase subunit alpha [Kordiimonas pumila]|uniref:Biotin carboxylase N-terminal domain-containing protein n=1 Tax=Kordiimonas pumila TaxID=2161677 RepID=A0ABV7D0I2_9PROT|nr:acetyl/propionyl/methylcrotonyl-CoA carboxylase subunit alpha [Kordiimonas pumila]
MSNRIQTLLIANRGEIACRIMKTCKRLGIRTVAVYSDADARSMHTQMADDAVHIGGAAATDSYLCADKILAAAKLTGADAIHPGYGFLSENPGFAESCAQNGIIFVGPSADAMRAMALKGAAKKLMEDANVPVVPGYHGDDQSVETLSKAAREIGFPVLIKAVAGGGGKGMRTVMQESELVAAIEGARREGKNSFSNDTLLIEKYIQKPRHIEIQVFADRSGHTVHLFERDCSLQRRHQKVIEEAPAPGMTAEMRAAMGSAAVKAAEAIGYEGAGTVEFIVDVENGLQDAPFYFMEMNTRLQVEHPVTEMITGQDLVEWQLYVAEGKPLPLDQKGVNAAVTGHAVEVRLYAEDPYHDFMPSTGTIALFNPDAPTSSNQRIDAGVKAGDAVTIYYDPMIAKLIAKGEDRESAIAALIALVQETPITGLATNRDFLMRLLAHKGFQDGDVHTGFIGTHSGTLLAEPVPCARDYAVAVFALAASRQNGADPWDVNDTFRMNLSNEEPFWFEAAEGESLKVVLQKDNRQYKATIGDQSFVADIVSYGDNRLRYVLDGQRNSVFVDAGTGHVTLITADTSLTLKRRTYDAGSDNDADGPGTVLSPMPGKILDVKASNGDLVSKGQALLVLEAMKMEQTIVAPRDGLVANLNLKSGDQISGGAILLTIEDAS